jgi:Protein of unknown function, DUF481.
MLLLTAFLALAPLPARAGDTAQTLQTADAAHWKTTGEFSFTDVAGNRSLSLLTARAGFGRTGGGELDMTGTVGVRYGRSSGDVAVEDFATGGELRFLPKGTVSPFVNASGTRDDIRRIAVRVAVAAGADLNLVRETDRSVSVGFALLQDYEAHQGSDTTAAAHAISLTRFNVRVTGKLPLRPGVSIVHRSTMEPAAGDLGDYLFTSETGLRVQVPARRRSRRPIASTAITTPPEGVQFRNDRTLTVGILIGA